MAGIFAQSQLIQSVRDEADLNPGPAGFVSDAMIATWINQGIADVQGRLLSSAEDYFLKPSGPISLLVGQSTYQLPWDLWKGRGIDVSTDPTFVNDVNTARPFNWKQRNMYNSAMGVYSFLGSTNLRYKFIPGTPATIKFIPQNAPGNTNVQVWYVPRAPLLVSALPTAYAAATVYAAGALVSVTLNGVSQVFVALNAGTSGTPGVGVVVYGSGATLNTFTQQVANTSITMSMIGLGGISVGVIPYAVGVGFSVVVTDSGATPAQVTAAVNASSAASVYVKATGSGGGVAQTGNQIIAPWSVPGLTSDNGITWSYVGPASIFQNYWDGFNGWEEWPILYAARKALDKQMKDTSVVQGRIAQLSERLAEETRNVDDDEPDFIVDSYYQDGSNGGLGGFGGGWFG